MKFALLSSAVTAKATDCLVLGVWTKGRLSAPAAAVDAALGGALARVVASGDVSGKLGDTLLVHPQSGTAKRLLLVGCGDADALDARSYRKAVSAAIKAVLKTTAKDAVFTLAELPLKDRDIAWATTLLVQECDAAAYQYDQTKSKKKPEYALKSIAVSAASAETRKAQTEAVKLGASIGLGVATTRELGNLPGNICTPTYLADVAVKLAGHYKSISTKVLSEAQMKKLGMGSLLSVSAGSAQEAKLIVMEYKGAAKADSKPVVLVGKGITFDTGGISLKPGLAMDEMKYDMCGAASVIGTLTAIAELGLKLNVVGVIAAAENMPGSKATKPGDIVTSMSGQTIEILNTDAEGRLILADALWYAQDKFKPKVVVDLATLTGAIVVALGNHFAGLYATTQSLADQLLTASKATGERLWQMPLDAVYDKEMESDVADIKNISGGRGGGSANAAAFLRKFIKPETEWAHLDIAGTAWANKDQGVTPKGAVGFGVRLLDQWIADNHEG